MSLLALLAGLALSADLTLPLTERVEEALAAEAYADGYDPGLVIDISQMTPVRGTVERISVQRYDPRSGYFMVEIGNGRVSKTITGRARAQTLAVVPTRMIAPGDMIDGSALRLAPVPIAHLGSDPILNIEDARGLVASRSLAAGRPLDARSLGRPLAVERNDPVMLSYQSERMRLTARGRALSEGAVGEIIKVMHEGGTAVVEARVTGPGRVAVDGGY